ncbi:MAG: hypothetical protein ACFCU4_07990 [Puniceicoccaceae bacterium]
MSRLVTISALLAIFSSFLPGQTFFQIGSPATSWGSLSLDSSIVTDGGTATVFQTSGSTSVNVDVAQWTFSISGIEALRITAFLERVGYDWTTEVSVGTGTTQYPTQPTRGLHPGTETGTVTKAALPNVALVSSGNRDQVLTGTETPRIFLGQDSGATPVYDKTTFANNPQGALYDPTNADDSDGGIGNQLANDAVGYSVRVSLEPLNGSSIQSIFTAGHGTKNPERIFFYGDTYGGFTQSANLDGFYTSGEWGRFDGAVDNTAQATSPTPLTGLNITTGDKFEFRYDTVGRQGRFQTMAIDQLGFTFVPEMNTLSLGGLFFFLLSAAKFLQRPGRG